MMKSASLCLLIKFFVDRSLWKMIPLYLEWTSAEQHDPKLSLASLRDSPPPLSVAYRQQFPTVSHVINFSWIRRQSSLEREKSIQKLVSKEFYRLIAKGKKSMTVWNWKNMYGNHKPCHPVMPQWFLIQNLVHFPTFKSLTDYCLEFFPKIF